MFWLGASLLAPVLIRPNPFLLFFPAVAVSAWYGGFGPGVLATILAALASWFFLLPATFPFTDETPLTLVRLSGLCLVALLITTLSANLRTERQRAAQARDTAEAARHRAEAEASARERVDQVLDVTLTHRAVADLLQA